MKTLKDYKIKIKIKFLIIVIYSMFISISVVAKDYYVSSANGSDSNQGTIDKPYSSIEKVNGLVLNAGDNIFFKAGDKFNGSLEFFNVTGTANKPVSVTTYGDESQRAFINGSGELAGIEIKNSRHIHISNFDIEANGGEQKTILDRKSPHALRSGVLIYIGREYNKTFGYITLDNLKIHDVFYYNFGEIDRGTDVNTPNGTQAYGYGINIFNRSNGANSLLTDILIKNTEIFDVAHTGIKTMASTPKIQNEPYPILKKSIKNVTVENTHLHHIGGPGIMFGGVDNGLIRHNVINKTGSSTDFNTGKYDARKWGRGSGMWTWNTNNVLVEHNEFKNAVGPADSAGFHIDFHCSNIVIQYNLSANNEGAFIEILGNNRNNSYRYNVSINDGYRVKGDKSRPYGRATHDGKTLWLSGFVGMKGRKVNPNIAPVNNYIYNNTVYVDHVAQLAAHNQTNGALIANNIFYFKKGSYYLPEKRYQLVKGRNTTKNLNMTNNLFLTAKDWPAVGVMENQNLIIGDPLFTHAGGMTIKDYTPTNLELVENKGEEINPNPGSNGLKGNSRSAGLSVSKDILGQPLNGQVHLGAIAPQKAKSKPHL